MRVVKDREKANDVLGDLGIVSSLIGTAHRREITALFCDLRGFTGFTEIADAEYVMALLRDYHAAIGEIIIKYNGTLERYAGDGVMVVFNDPVPVEKPLYADDAVLWGTLSPMVRSDRAALRDYFVTAFRVPPAATRYKKQGA